MYALKIESQLQTLKRKGIVQAPEKVGLGMTNASPIVAPPGGRSRVIGTNPVSFAAPDGQGGVAGQWPRCNGW